MFYKEVYTLPLLKKHKNICIFYHSVAPGLLDWLLEEKSYINFKLNVKHILIYKQAIR